ncbi:MAG: hypothetical protein EOP54_09855 [Sphingobacteriales bacterium]|nr:MAG: hypothetical protein EOP54_09855 [Sphingobacteriales bacterium]
MKQEFGISDETRSNWLKFIKESNLLEKDAVAKLLEHEKDNDIQVLSKGYCYKKSKMSLFNYSRIFYILNGDNPTSVMVFNKKHVSCILKDGSKNLYKNIEYKAFGAEVTFEKFPFTIFKEILENNYYEFRESDFKEDFEGIAKHIS